MCSRVLMGMWQWHMWHNRDTFRYTITLRSVTYTMPRLSRRRNRAVQRWKIKFQVFFQMKVMYHIVPKNSRISKKKRWNSRSNYGYTPVYLKVIRKIRFCGRIDLKAILSSAFYVHVTSRDLIMWLITWLYESLTRG